MIADHVLKINGVFLDPIVLRLKAKDIDKGYAYIPADKAKLHIRPYRAAVADYPARFKKTL